MFTEIRGIAERGKRTEIQGILQRLGGHNKREIFKRWLRDAELLNSVRKLAQRDEEYYSRKRP